MDWGFRIGDFGLRILDFGIRIADFGLGIGDCMAARFPKGMLVCDLLNTYQQCL